MKSHNEPSSDDVCPELDGQKLRERTGCSVRSYDKKGYMQGCTVRRVVVPGKQTTALFLSFFFFGYAA